MTCPSCCRLYKVLFTTAPPDHAKTVVYQCEMCGRFYSGEKYYHKCRRCYGRGHFGDASPCTLCDGLSYVVPEEKVVAQR